MKCIALIRNSILLVVLLCLLHYSNSTSTSVKKILNITLYRVEAGDETPEDPFGSRCDYFGYCDLQVIFCIRHHYATKVQNQKSHCENYKRVELTQDSNYWSGITTFEMDIDQFNEHKYLQYRVEDTDLMFNDNIFIGSVMLTDLDDITGVRKFINNSHIRMRLILRDPEL